MLAGLFDDVAAREIGEHDDRQSQSELNDEGSVSNQYAYSRKECQAEQQEKKRAYRSSHLNELKPPVGLWEEIDRAVVGDGNDTQQTPVQRRVLGDTLSEGTTLEVDGERRDLLGKAEEVDGGVEEGRLELGVEVDDASARKIRDEGDARSAKRSRRVRETECITDSSRLLERMVM